MIITVTQGGKRLIFLTTRNSKGLFNHSALLAEDGHRAIEGSNVLGQFGIILCYQEAEAVGYLINRGTFCHKFFP